MIVRRRTWYYRLAGQKFAHAISFKTPLTASKVREALNRKFNTSLLELWA